MSDEASVPYGRRTQTAPKISEVHVLWLNDGMSCDGDSVSITAASDPSIEDIVLGAIPGIPKVHLHNRVLSYENGDEMMQYFHKAANGELENFIVVMEGSAWTSASAWSRRPIPASGKGPNELRRRTPPITGIARSARS
jgi:hydrogenase small subunit